MHAKRKNRNCARLQRLLYLGGLLASAVTGCSRPPDQQPAATRKAGSAEIEIHEVQEAVIRSIPPEAGSSFAYYCLAVNPGQLNAPASRDDRLLSTRERSDPGDGLLRKLRRRHLGFVAASECGEVDDELMHLPSRSKHALLVAVGAVEMTAEGQAVVMVFTTSGFLTETFTLFTVEKTRGAWTVVSEEIVLQA